MMRRKISLEQNRSFHRRNDSLPLFPVFLSHLVFQPFRVVLTVISMAKITLVVVLSIEWSWLKNFIDRVNCNRLGDSDLVRLDFFVAAIIIESVFTFHSMTRQAPFTLTTLFVSDNTDMIGCWADPSLRYFASHRDLPVEARILGEPAFESPT